MIDLLNWLLDSSTYLTRAHCGDWPAELKWTWIASNGIIAFTYLAIPAAIIVFWRRVRTRVVRSWLLVLYAAFIASCGLTHLTEILVWWWATYRLYTLFYVVTALVSLAALVVSPLVFRDLVAMPSAEEFRRLHEECLLVVADRDRLLARLRRQVADLEHMRDTGIWVQDQDRQLRELRSLLGRMSRPSFVVTPDPDAEPGCAASGSDPE